MAAVANAAGGPAAAPACCSRRFFFLTTRTGAPFAVVHGRDCAKSSSGEACWTGVSISGRGQACTLHFMFVCSTFDVSGVEARQEVVELGPDIESAFKFCRTHGQSTASLFRGPRRLNPYDAAFFLPPCLAGTS